MNYFKQLIYDMRHQKMMMWVSISGTAVSIFLVLVFFMVNSLPTVEVVPETNRHLIYGSPLLAVEVIEGERKGWNINGSYFSYPYARQMFEDLDGVDKVSYITLNPSSVNVTVADNTPVIITAKRVDGAFWNIYDFNFVTGRPFKEDECLDSNRPPIVLTRSSARKLFGSEDVEGHAVSVNGVTYFVTGIVENTSPILKNTYAEAYLPVDDRTRRPGHQEPEFEPTGELMALLLFNESTNPDDVIHQINSRLATMNVALNKINANASLRDLQTPEMMGTSRNYSRSQNIKDMAKRQYLIYALLLILPAINMSSMMRGRLQDRISEIGVRRAYGARRRDIIYQLFGENLLVTLVGGLIGLLLSYLFMMLMASSFISFVDSWYLGFEDTMANPTFSMLFTWQAFAIALVACFVLNILTASVPAWRASSIPPSAAISKSRT